jgi:predicted flap endonuclease-1-like 5' DNA nuclease
MKSTYDGLINLAFVWGIASATGFAAMAALMLIGDWSVMQGLFAAAIIFFVLGAVLSLLFLKPLGGPVRPGTAGWGATSAPSKPAAPAPAAPATPAPAAPAAEAETGEGTRPAALDAPREGGADDLKRIKGVGPKLEQLCNTLGFYHFDQIAAWTPAEVAWVDENLEGFKGRVTRDDWVAQAKLLAEGGETDFSRKVDGGDVY